MSGEKITVDSNKVTINDYEISDEDVVKHFDTLKEQGKNLDDELDKLLKLGAIAAKATTVGLSTDYVDKSVNDLKNNFENLFGQTFDENGTIPRLLAENFGEENFVRKHFGRKSLARIFWEETLGMSSLNFVYF